jgi:tetratricopeptide (TPR) repeat protein
MPVYVLFAGFTLWMAIEAVRRGDAGRWLWIILMFGPMGAAVYFFSEYLSGGPLRHITFRTRKVSAADLKLAEVDVRRLDNAASWTDYASLLRSRKDYARAADAARRAVERDPASLDAQYELGLAFLSAGRYAEAREALAAVIARNRCFDSDDALFALAKAEIGAGDCVSARADLEELAGRRGRPEILYELAGAQAVLQDREAALRSLQRIVDEAVLVPAYLQRNVRPWVRRARWAMRKLR